MSPSPAGPRSAHRRRRPHPLVVAAVCVVLLLTGAGVVRHTLVQPFRVPSASMAPTLEPGDLVLADRTDRGTARRGDVVVLDGTGYFPAHEGSHHWVKRVVALGGDRVACCTDDGAITVDGEPLDEPYLAPGTAPSTVTFDLEVPAGRMFLLGDDRDDSLDSRGLLGAPGGGMVPVERVVGTVHGVVWPPSRRTTW